MAKAKNTVPKRIRRLQELLDEIVRKYRFGLLWTPHPKVIVFHTQHLGYLASHPYALKEKDKHLKQMGLDFELIALELLNRDIDQEFELIIKSAIDMLKHHSHKELFPISVGPIIGISRVMPHQVFEDVVRLIIKNAINGDDNLWFEARTAREKAVTFEEPYSYFVPKDLREEIKRNWRALKMKFILSDDLKWN